MLETARDQGYPKITQIAFFLANRVGSLQRVVTVLDQARIRILGISILDAHDHAVVRMIVDKPAKAADAIIASGRQICTTELLGVGLQNDGEHGFEKMLATLLEAELNVLYVYTMLIQHDGGPVLAVHTDTTDTAAETLRRRGFELIEQHDLDRG